MNVLESLCSPKICSYALRTLYWVLYLRLLPFLASGTSIEGYAHLFSSLCTPSGTFQQLTP